MDRLTAERRSWNMSRIRGKDTKPERKVRSLLHQTRLSVLTRETAWTCRATLILCFRGTEPWYLCMAAFGTATKTAIILCCRKRDRNSGLRN